MRCADAARCRDPVAVVACRGLLPWFPWLL